MYLVWTAAMNCERVVVLISMYFYAAIICLFLHVWTCNDMSPIWTLRVVFQYSLQGFLLECKRKEESGIRWQGGSENPKMVNVLIQYSMQKAGKQLSFNRFPQRHQVQRVLILVCTNFAFACRLSKEALVGYIWKYWKMCDAQLQILENVTPFFDCTVYSFCSCLYPGQHITTF